MTINRLSAQSVKVQLSADELQVFLPDSQEQNNPDSPHMLRLLAFLLSKAELASGIPFSQLPVTVELITTSENGLAAYFTIQEQQKNVSNPQSQTVRLAAKFSSTAILQECCQKLINQKDAILSSNLYRYKNQYIISMKLQRHHASGIHHLLLEYGRPFRLSQLNRARLNEYGICLREKDAITYATRAQL